MPQLADRAVWSVLKLSPRDLLLQAGASAQIVVRVEIRILIVLSSKYFPPQSEIQGEARRYLPRILAIHRIVVITVAAAEVRQTNRQSQRTGSDGTCLTARILTLRIYGNLIAVDVPLQEILERLRNACAQIFAGSFVSAEGTVVPKIVIAAAKT